MNRPQLILDVAGVIATNLSPGFWEEAAMAGGTSYRQLKDRFRREIRESFWTGDTTMEQFRDWLAGHGPDLSMERLNALAMKYLQPLPALERISSWSREAAVHLLSNHREEWLSGLLEPVKDQVKSLTISSRAGYCKPDPRIYQLICEHFSDGEGPCIYVDDQEKNLIPARALGWHTVIADSEGRWVEEVSRLLKQQRIRKG
ncbi:putative hydrolase of the HAD superfamily [Paenibacillus rhizosphaerae]|uniref:Putative hydrolase of the HAD superfamily n=1 Tax=Paenibacillus rhizosphaerae TaxID=297318 RepID=A0A839TXN8_9BACL|nr:HAD-IA family hydrolase [Paenibacillus rhizosphaerae]MBB3129407.1 putative hydrolase of the HAD superfamily [Paenibacillus rhizosphaerae]